MNHIWTNEWWNIIHIFSALLSEKKEKQLFYDILYLLATPDIKNWLQLHQKEYDTTELFSWTYQLKKNIIHSTTTEKKLQTYYHKNSITKDVWGPLLWKWFHHVVLQVDPNCFQTIFLLFIQLLPCMICRKHALEYYETHPFTNDMATWMITFHNNVSDQINKKDGTKKQLYKTFSQKTLA